MLRLAIHNRVCLIITITSIGILHGWVENQDNIIISHIFINVYYD